VIVFRAAIAAFLMLWAAGVYTRMLATESEDRWLGYVVAVVIGTAAMVVIGW